MILDLDGQPRPVPLTTYLNKTFPQKADPRRWQKIRLRAVEASAYLESFSEAGNLAAEIEVVKKFRDFKNPHSRPLSLAEFIQERMPPSSLRTDSLLFCRKLFPQ